MFVCLYVCVSVCLSVYVCLSVCAGPKIEYLLMNLMVMSLMLALYMTGNMIVVYVTSALIGLSRAAVFTVPFMMASNICHMEVGQKENYVTLPPPPPSERERDRDRIKLQHKII